MNYWVMKSEPDVFSIDDLKRAKTTQWEGVRNYQVRNFFRDDMRVGDRALFYHSNCTPPGIVGEMEVVEVGLIDPWQFDASSEYFDRKSIQEAPRWLAPRVAFRKKFLQPVSLQEIRELPAFQSSPLVGKGNRLSVVPLTRKQYEVILRSVEA